jgi:hypothetical protein
MKILKHYFRQIKKLPGWIYFPAALLIKTVLKLMKKEIHDPLAGADAGKFPYVTVIWHNRLLFLGAIFPRKVREKSVAMVSASRDGQYLADLLAQFQVGSIRGSSSKRSGTVVREAVAALESKFNVVITPDGPRGPRYRMSPGPIQLARLTGAPIVPVSINADSYWELRSWDRFQIPKPWTKITLEIGAPIPIPPDLDDDTFEKYRQLVEAKLLAITKDRPEPAVAS